MGRDLWGEGPAVAAASRLSAVGRGSKTGAGLRGGVGWGRAGRCGRVMRECQCKQGAAGCRGCNGGGVGGVRAVHSAKVEWGRQWGASGSRDAPSGRLPHGGYAWGSARQRRVLYLPRPGTGGSCTEGGRGKEWWGLGRGARRCEGGRGGFPRTSTRVHPWDERGRGHGGCGGGRGAVGGEGGREGALAPRRQQTGNAQAGRGVIYAGGEAPPVVSFFEPAARWRGRSTTHFKFERGESAPLDRWLERIWVWSSKQVIVCKRNGGELRLD